MSYEQIQALSSTGGLIYFIVLFAGALAYALWPRNKATFDHAATAILDDSDLEETAEETL